MAISSAGPRPYRRKLSRCAPCGRAGALRIVSDLDALDDAQVPHAGFAENLQGGLIGLAVMGRDRLRDTVELDDDDALSDAGLIGLGGVAAGEEATAGGLDRGARELRISR